MFGWELAGVVPTSGFSLYHSAIRRSLLDKIRERAGGKYFEHPVVDYDMAMKIITTGSSFVYCERPFSVMGVCPEANSFGIGRLSDTKAKISSFDNELGRSFDRDDYLRDFPFYNLLGVPCSIAIAQHWFKKHYNYSYSGWEKNFVEACARYVELFPNRDEFDFMKQAYLDTLEKWQGGRFTKHFKPKLPEQSSGPAGGGGFTETGVYVKSNIGGASNPYELFDIVSAFVRPTNLIDTKDILSAPKATDDRRQGRK